MFSLTYDELKQRHREQQIRKKVKIAVSISTFLLAFSVISTIAVFTILNQKKKLNDSYDKLETKTAELQASNDNLAHDQAIFLAKESEEYLANNDCENAIRSAYYALTLYNDTPMPYTDEAMFALTKSLNPYGFYNSTNNADFMVETPGILRDYQISYSGDTVMLYDDTDCITFVSVIDNKIINTIDSPIKQYQNNIVWCNAKLINDNTMIYSNNGVFYSYNITEDNSTLLCDNYVFDDMTSFSYNYEDDSLLIVTYSTLYSYYPNTNKLIKHLDVSSLGNQYSNSSLLYAIDGNNDCIYLYCADEETGKWYCLYYDLGSEQLISCFEYGSSYLTVLLDIFSNSKYTYSYSITYPDNSDNYTISDISCFENSSGELIWNYSFDSNEKYEKYKEKLFACKNQDNDNYSLLVVSDYSVFELELMTGKLLYKKDMNRIINTSYTNPSSTGYSRINLFLSDLTRKTYKNRKITVSNDFFTYENKDGINYLDYTSKGYIIVPVYSNKTFFYSPHNDKEMLTTDKIYDIENIYVENDEAVLMAEKYKIDSSSLVDTIAMDNSDNPSKLFVTYRNGMVRLYSIKSKMAFLEYEDTFSVYDEYVTRYVGMDKAGNSYWASSDFGYCFSKDNNLIAVIEALVTIDVDNNKLVIGWNEEQGDNYLVPIYSMYELLLMAEDYLGL